MTLLAEHTLAITGVLAGLCILGMLHALASIIHFEVSLHNLKARTIDLRLRQMALARAARDMIDPELIPSDTESIVRFILLGALPDLPGQDAESEGSDRARAA